jgi:hypothetical protein
MSDDTKERLRKLRDEIGAVIDILESVKERTRGFDLKQVAAETASLANQSKFDDLKTQLAEKISKLAGAEGPLAARRRDHDQLYLNWLAVKNKLAIIAYFRRLRDNCSQAACVADGRESRNNLRLATPPGRSRHH